MAIIRADDELVFAGIRQDIFQIVGNLAGDVEVIVRQ